MKRPSHKEITNKIVQAKKALKKDKLLFINPGVLVSDALELGFLFDTEVNDVLDKLLNGASPEILWALNHLKNFMSKRYMDLNFSHSE
jgi:hypothetical protein